MKIAIGCDPNAAAMKSRLMEFIRDLGHEVGDFGSDDPIYAKWRKYSTPGAKCRIIKADH